MVVTPRNMRLAQIELNGLLNGKREDIELEGSRKGWSGSGRN